MKKGESGKPRKRPTALQSRFAKEYMVSKSAAQAARAAGYSPKHAAQSGYQALRQLKVPELLDEAGYSLPVLIKKYLAPKLEAKETKFATDEGEFTDFVEMEDNAAQLNAIDKMLRMHGAYAPTDPREAAQFGVKVVIIDVPRPQIGVYMPDVGPGQLPPVSPKPNGANGLNGAKTNGNKPPREYPA